MRIFELCLTVLRWMGWTFLFCHLTNIYLLHVLSAYWKNYSLNGISLPYLQSLQLIYEKSCFIEAVAWAQQKLPSKIYFNNKMQHTGEWPDTHLKSIHVFLSGNVCALFITLILFPFGHIANILCWTSPPMKTSILDNVKKKKLKQLK